jgi:hypothetical protein
MAKVETDRNGNGNRNGRNLPCRMRISKQKSKS